MNKELTLKDFIGRLNALDKEVSQSIEAYKQESIDLPNSTHTVIKVVNIVGEGADTLEDLAQVNFLTEHATSLLNKWAFWISELNK